MLKRKKGFQLSSEVPIETRGPFLEAPDNFPGPKDILGAQYSPIAIQFLLILKAKS